MTTNGENFASESWDFALKLYAEPGVAEACLQLQSEAGVDVMMMLVATFAAARCRLLLTASDIESMDLLCRPWRKQIVHSLRALRTALKTGPLPAPSPETEQLRSQIKASELLAERLQNNLLADHLKTKEPLARALTHDEIAGVIYRATEYALGNCGTARMDALLPGINVIVSTSERLMTAP